MKSAKRSGGRNLLAFAVAVFMLSGCLYPPAMPPSEGHIKPDSRPPTADIPPPVQVSSYLPPPKPTGKPEVYSVVVKEVPVKGLLFALARDSKVNIDVHPAIRGLVTMNAVDEPLSTILDRLAEQVSLRYKFSGNTLVITPDTPYLHTYRVDYVNLRRQTTSNIGITTQIASVGSSTAAGGQVAGGGGAVGNSSTTQVKTESDNAFWDNLEKNIGYLITNTNREINRARDKEALSADELAKRDREEREERRKDARALLGRGRDAGTTGDAEGAGVSVATQVNLVARGENYRGALALADKVGIGQSQRIDEFVTANPAAGTISVLATQYQHKLVKQYLDSVMQAAQRQVLIEATIVEVELTNEYQAGVDWKRLVDTGSISQNLLGANIATPPNFVFTYTNATSERTISATVRMLEQFGDTKVLSSPKVMALNNQTAVLKVVNNLVYFSISVVPAVINSTGGVTTPATYTSDAHTVPVGVVMSVTPQINEDGLVSLTVRPTISRLLDYVNDPNPDLKDVPNKVPEIQVREMESVMQVRSGETAILGGLMQDDVKRSKQGLPLLSRLTGVGDAFSYRDDSLKKTELVIFLRPTVINNPSLDTGVLQAYRPYLPNAPQAPLAKP